MSGALSPERQKLRQAIVQAERERNVALIKSLMKVSFDNDCFEELLELNRIVERFSDSNRGVDLSRALLERNPDLPSVLIVALPRSGSTYLRDSVIRTWGFKNYLCYNSNELGFTECDGLYSTKLGLGGLIARMHSEANAAELERIEQSGISKLVLLIRNPIEATLSLLRREGLEKPDLDRAKQLARQNILWLRAWKDQKVRLKEHCLVLRYEDAVRDWAGAVRDVGEFYGLDRLEPVVAGEQSKNRFNRDLDLGHDLYERIMQGESCLGIEEFYRW